MGGTVLVLGASGNFGARAVEAFKAAGWKVRRYQRGTDMAAAAMGADVIVNGLNPPKYHSWATLIPEITAKVIAAAKASGATVIVPGNVYVYGRAPGPWGPQTPHQPVTRKGRIRAEMEASYRAASGEGVQVVILRGGDFIDPTSEMTIFRMVIAKGVSRGKLTAMGRAGAGRAYAWLPDMARAAVELAQMRAQLPAFNDVPFAGFTLSMTEIAAHLQRLTQRPMRVRQFSWGIMWALQPVWELARELWEMRYLYELDHRLDPAPMAALLPAFKGTPVEVALQAQL